MSNENNVTNQHCNIKLLNAIMQHRGVTDEQMAEMIGIPIYLWEKHKRNCAFVTDEEITISKILHMTDTEYLAVFAPDLYNETIEKNSV